MIFISFTFGSLFAQDINEISAFTFASSTGHEFSINYGTAALDFEGGKGTYNIDIECTHGRGLEGMAQGTITVADSNENPAVQALTLNVEENALKRKATQHAVNIVDSRSNTTSASIHDATLLFTDRLKANGNMSCVCGLCRGPSAEQSLVSIITTLLLCLITILVSCLISCFSTYVYINFVHEAMWWRWKRIKQMDYVCTSCTSWILVHLKKLCLTYCGKIKNDKYRMTSDDQKAATFGVVEEAEKGSAAPSTKDGSSGGERKASDDLRNDVEEDEKVLAEKEERERVKENEKALAEMEEREQRAASDGSATWVTNDKGPETSSDDVMPPLPHSNG